MKRKILIITGITICTATARAQTYPENESSTYQDLLTPAYYSAPIGDAFRNEINKYIFFARQECFHHPLEDEFGVTPSYTIPSEGTFEAGKGPGGTGEHHKANDLHVGSDDSLVTMYAAIDGYVSTYYDQLIYRDYLTITKDVKDSNDVVLGKMVVIYGHLDLIKDTTAGLFMDGQYVSKGDVVSNFLYSGTVGGPHLHFEIRYYRVGDAGTETYYGFTGAGLTDPSAGIWTYGLWNPSIGYGFGQMENHFSCDALNIKHGDIQTDFKIYPNPSSNIFYVEKQEAGNEFNCSLVSPDGRVVFQDMPANNKIMIDLNDEGPGIYFLIVKSDRIEKTYKIIHQ